jgi:hypothetical protein
MNAITKWRRSSRPRQVKEIELALTDLQQARVQNDQAAARVNEVFSKASQEIGAQAEAGINGPSPGNASLVSAEALR